MEYVRESEEEKQLKGHSFTALWCQCECIIIIFFSQVSSAQFNSDLYVNI